MKFKLVLTLLLLSITTLPLLPPLHPLHAQDPLPQSYISPNGSIRFHYPDGWAAGEFAGFASAVGNDPTLLNQYLEEEGLDTIPSGFTILLILSVAGNTLFELDPDMGLAEAAAYLRSQTSGSNTEISAPTPLTLGDYAAMRLDVHDEEAEGFYILIDNRGTIMLSIGVAAAGEMPQYEATLLAILATLIYSDPDPTISVPYTSNDGRLSLRHPGNWQILSDSIGHVSLTDNSLTVDIHTPISWTQFSILRPLSNRALAELIATLYQLPILTITDTTLANSPAVRLDTPTGLLLVWQVNGAQLILKAQAASEAITQHESALLALAESVQYTLVEFGGAARGDLPFDTPITATVEAEIYTDHWIVAGSPGDLLQITLTEAIPEDGLSQHLATLYDADGVEITGIAPNFPSYTLVADTRPYSLTVSNFSTETAYPYTLTVNRFTPDGILPLGGSITNEAFTSLYTLEGTAGQLLSLSLTSEGFSPLLTLYGPHGFKQSAGLGGSLQTLLPVDSTYFVVIEASGGAYTLSANLLESTPIALGDTIQAALPSPFYALTVEANTALTIHVQSTAFEPNIQLYNPNGQLIQFPDTPLFQAIQTIQTTLVIGGTYYLQVNSFIAIEGEFTLSVE